jgi:hypothetical protein
VFLWGAASMEETASRRNNLPLLFLHLGVTPTGGAGVDGPVISPISRSSEIRVWWSVVGTLVGGDRVDCCSCVWCLAVRRVDDGRRERSSSSTASDEVDGVEIW